MADYNVCVLLKKDNWNYRYKILRVGWLIAKKKKSWWGL